MKRAISVLIIFFLFTSINISAQNTEIEITDLTIENNQLVIYYNILKAKKKQTFEVWPEITTANGQTINASSFSGDYGEGITPGIGKKIIWDYNADGVVLNDKVFVEIKAKIAITHSGTSLGKALLLSAIVPGLGITKNKGKGYYWLMSIPVYSLSLAAAAKYQSAQDDYNEYLNELEDISRAEDYFLSAIDAQEASQVFTYSAIGVWAVNMIWTGISVSKNKSLANLNNKKTMFFSNINPLNKTVGFTFRYRF